MESISKGIKSEIENSPIKEYNTSSLDLNELSRRLTEQLNKETWLSLTIWIWKDRIRCLCYRWFH